MTGTQLIVPWRAGCPHRERAWQHLAPMWRRLGLEPQLAEASPGPWVKAHAVRPAVEATSADVLIVADADVWVPGIGGAIDAVTSGRPWAVPHTDVHRLTEAATGAVLAGAPMAGQPTEQPPYEGVMSGGVLVVRRDVWLDVPLDPRYEGWGSEDHAQGWALETLHGPPWRRDGPLHHLWHPHPARLTRHIGSMENERLRRWYFAHRANPAGMRRLIEEAKTWPQSVLSSTGGPSTT